MCVIVGRDGGAQSPKNSVAVMAFVSWERWVFVRPVLLMSSERVKGTG